VISVSVSIVGRSPAKGYYWRGPRIFGPAL